MLDEIFNSFCTVLDSAGTLNSKKRSIVFKVLGCIVWLLLIVGIIGLFLYWFKS